MTAWSGWKTIWKTMCLWSSFNRETTSERYPYWQTPQGRRVWRARTTAPWQASINEYSTSFAATSRIFWSRWRKKLWNTPILGDSSRSRFWSRSNTLLRWRRRKSFSMKYSFTWMRNILTRKPPYYKLGRSASKYSSSFRGRSNCRLKTPMGKSNT